MSDGTITLLAMFFVEAHCAEEFIMLKRPMVWGLIALIVGGIALVLYDYYRVPAGLEPMSDSTETLAWLSLATAVVGLLTGIIGLIKAIVEARARRP